MKFVVDTNIIFSAILNPESKIGQIILNGSKFFTFVSVNQLKTEIDNHEDKILTISGLNRLEYLKLSGLILKKIKFVHHLLIDDNNYQKAGELTQNIDPDDLLFVGLAMQLHCKLWTGDKKLIKGLELEGFKQTITTEQLFQIYLDKEFKRRIIRT
jgi:predicted nucleic acid-binding protein